MKYVIMCDGKGTRWNNYSNITKQECIINGERLIDRTSRLLNEFGVKDVIITSKNPMHENKYSLRIEPKESNKKYKEYVYEFLNEEICFLYGDTYYSKETLMKIIETPIKDVMFFGNSKAIIAVKIKDYNLFKDRINYVNSNEYNGCGNALYHSFDNIKYNSKLINRFIILESFFQNINEPKDYYDVKVKVKGKKI